MNTRSSRAEEAIIPFSVAYNRTGETFTIAYDKGYSIYRTTTGEQVDAIALPLEIKYAAQIDNTQFTAVSTLFGTKILLRDRKANEWVADTLDVQDVRSLVITKTRLIVVARSFTHLYKVNPFEKLAVFETAENNLGLCSMGTAKFAIPGRAIGQVQVIDIDSGRAKQILPAHNSPLAAVEVSKDDAYLATASEKGTLFRIFILPDTTKVAELRRGIEFTDIFSLKMSPDNAYLAVTSAKGTLHIFSLASQPPGPAETPNLAVPMARTGSQGSILVPSKAVSSDSNSIGQGSPSRNSPRQPSPYATSPTADYIMVGGSPPGTAEAKASPIQKFGSVISKLPFAPSFVRDQYSDASIRFDVGPINFAASRQETPNVPTRGQIRWVDETTFVVVRVRPTCFWEKFMITRSSLDGSLQISRIDEKDLEVI